MDTKRFLELVADAGADARSYSGRGMYGKECVGVDTDNAILTTARIVAQAEDREEAEDLEDAFSSARTDSMGHSSILYFPTLRWEHDAAPAPECDYCGDPSKGVDDHDRPTCGGGDARDCAPLAEAK